MSFSPQPWVYGHWVIPIPTSRPSATRAQVPSQAAEPVLRVAAALAPGVAIPPPPPPPPPPRPRGRGARARARRRGGRGARPAGARAPAAPPPPPPPRRCSAAGGHVALEEGIGVRELGEELVDFRHLAVPLPLLLLVHH